MILKLTRSSHESHEYSGVTDESHKTHDWHEWWVTHDSLTKDVVSVSNVSVLRRVFERLGLVSWKGQTSRSCLGLVTHECSLEETVSRVETCFRNVSVLVCNVSFTSIFIITLSFSLGLRNEKLSVWVYFIKFNIYFRQHVRSWTTQTRKKLQHTRQKKREKV